jgi:hypothetical protein
MDLQDLICSPFNDTEFIHVSNDIKLYNIISYSSLNDDHDYDSDNIHNINFKKYSSTLFYVFLLFFDHFSCKIVAWYPNLDYRNDMIAMHQLNDDKIKILSFVD